MKITVNYATVYEYARPVEFAPHLFRIFPRAERWMKVLKCEFATTADAVVHYRRDIFDNEIARCFYPNAHRELPLNLALELEVQERNAFDFLVDPAAFQYPFQYSPHDQRVLAPYLTTDGAPLEVPFWKPEPQETVALVTGANQAIYDNLGYERRDEGPAWDPMETLRNGSGACRDFSVLLAEMLRRAGIAARLVSGYILELTPGDLRAAGAMHAWVEAYLPGAGWIGLDPTNGYLCNHHHISAAVGLTADDVTPVFGKYCSTEVVPCTMQMQLEVRCE